MQYVELSSCRTKKDHEHGEAACAEKEGRGRDESECANIAMGDLATAYSEDAGEIDWE